MTKKDKKKEKFKPVRIITSWIAKEMYDGKAYMRWSCDLTWARILLDFNKQVKAAVSHY